MGIYLKKYAWVIYLFFIFLGAYFLAKITSSAIASKIRIEKDIKTQSVAMVGEEEKRRATFEDYKVIIDRNMFDSRETQPAVAVGTPAPTEVNLEGPAVKTSLSIKLISTMVIGAGTDRRSTATVQGGSGAGEGGVDTYSIGDEKTFAPGVKLTKIMPGRIQFINGPRLEYDDIEQFGGGLTTTKPISAIDSATATGSKTPEAGGKTVEGGKFVVERAELDQAIGNLDQLFTQIRAVPQVGPDGKSSGLKLLSIKGGSLFAKLGLKRNDVLERINGQDFDMKKGLEIFTQLKESNRITIDLVREGKKTTLEYDIQ